MARKRKASDELYNQRRRLKRQLEKAAKAADVAEYERLAGEISVTYKSIQHQALFEQSAQEISFKFNKPSVATAWRGAAKKIKREIESREIDNAAEAFERRFSAEMDRKRRQKEIDKAQMRHKQINLVDFANRYPDESVSIFIAATRDIWNRPNIKIDDRFEYIKEALGVSDVQEAVNEVMGRDDVQKAMRAMEYQKSGYTDSTLAPEFAEVPMPDEKYQAFYYLQFVL